MTLEDARRIITAMNIAVAMSSTAEQRKNSCLTRTVLCRKLRNSLTLGPEEILATKPTGDEGVDYNNCRYRQRNLEGEKS